VADINDVMLAMNKGFSDLHTKFDAKFDDFREEYSAHVLACSQRFGDIEQEQAVKRAVNGVKEKEDEKKLDVWKYIIRASIVIMTGGIFTVIWKLFVGHIDIIAK